MDGRTIFNAGLGGVITAAIIWLLSLVPGLFERIFAVVPAHAVVAFADKCPSIGWHPYGAAEGRYIVGAKPGGNIGETVGTPLTNAENRATGNHHHTVNGLSVEGTDNTNGLVYPFTGHGGYAKLVKPAYATTDTTYEGKQAVDGTNAPYVQLQLCERE